MKKKYVRVCAIRKLDSLSKFKNAIRLNSQSNKISVPKLYYLKRNEEEVCACVCVWMLDDVWLVH
jgi:hypothetical protein